jgi:hypothetical protein
MYNMASARGKAEGDAPPQHCATAAEAIIIPFGSSLTGLTLMCSGNCADGIGAADEENSYSHTQFFDCAVPAEPEVAKGKERIK